MKPVFLPTFALTLLLLASACSKPLELEIAEVTASSIRLEWSGGPDAAARFLIERDTGDGWISAGQASSNETRFASIGLLGNTEVKHRLIAEETSGRISVSNTVIATTEPPFSGHQGRIIETSTPRQSEGAIIKVGDELHMYYCSFTEKSDKARSRIARKVSRDNGDTWSAQELVFDQQTRAADEFPGMGKPGWHLLHPQSAWLANGNLCLSYAKMVPHTWYAHRVFRLSEDGGKTWSPEMRLSDDSYDYATGASDRMYRLSNDRIISLVHVKMPGEGKYTGIATQVFVLDPEHHDNPQGKWRNLTETPFFVDSRLASGGNEWGFWEASLAEHAPGQLLMLGRSATGRFYETRSADYGNTWTAPIPSVIPAPITPPYLKMLPGGKRMVLIWNPYVDGHDWHMGDRLILAASTSSDGGRNWSNYQEIEYNADGHWYNYPFGIVDGDALHLAYDVWTPDRKERLLGYLRIATDTF